MKKFLISIDTEGDNLWQWDGKTSITTRNVDYLSRFQALCNRYGFKPTYLTNWEMISDPKFCELTKAWVSNGQCEIGMHLHAWNSPPYESLAAPKNTKPGLPYLIEYPDDVMDSKIDTMTEAIENNIGVRPITHRAGRWTMDRRYFELLASKGYLCDCSVTPHINWTSSPGQTNGVFGSDYSDEPEEPYQIRFDKSRIVEIPLTVRKTHAYMAPAANGVKPFAKSLLNVVRGQSLQLRPNGNNLNEMIWLEKHIAQSTSEYIMFMLHSSEFMPGGSPTFKDEAAIEGLYEQLEKLFDLVSIDFEGETIGAYAMELISNNSLERSGWIAR